MRQFLYISPILQLWLLIILLVSSSMGMKLRGKKKIAKEKELNICDTQVQQALIFCHCNKPQNVTSADCSLMSKFESDSLWVYFKSHIHLEILALTMRQNGSLDDVPNHLLRQLKNLHTVKFRFANFHKIAEHTFNNFDIVNLYLERNMIVTLQKNAFENMQNLIDINLDENRISEIHRDVFVNLPNLHKLSLNSNNINTIHDKAFKHLNLLQELDLSNNQITSIMHDIFYGLRNLQRLDLHENQIATIEKRNFAEMPELIELELDQNAITYISERAFDGMYNLQKLELSNNLLMKLPQDFLAGASGIRFLNLSFNGLTTMTFDNIKPIVTNLYDINSQFNLTGNELICDCKLTWIWGLRNETKNKELRQSLDELTCFIENNNATHKNNYEGHFGKFAKEYSADYSRNDGNEYNKADERVDDENFSSNSNDKVNKCCIKYLFSLKPEDLPCPELSREDLMASEQPSIRHENARVGSGSSWFSSGSISVQADRSVLATFSLLSLSILFFT